MVMRMYTNKWRDQGLFQELRQHVAWLLQQRHPLIGSPEAAVGAALTQSWDLVEVDELWSILIAWNTLTRVSLRMLQEQRLGALPGSAGGVTCCAAAENITAAAEQSLPVLPPECALQAHLAFLSQAAYHPSLSQEQAEDIAACLAKHGQAVEIPLCILL